MSKDGHRLPPGMWVLHPEGATPCLFSREDEEKAKEALLERGEGYRLTFYWGGQPANQRGEQWPEVAISDLSTQLVFLEGKLAELEQALHGYLAAEDAIGEEVLINLPDDGEGGCLFIGATAWPYGEPPPGMRGGVWLRAKVRRPDGLAQATEIAARVAADKRVADLEHAFDDAREGLLAAGVNREVVERCLGSGASVVGRSLLPSREPRCPDCGGLLDETLNVEEDGWHCAKCDRRVTALELLR